MAKKPTCRHCHGKGWICEEHPEQPWPHDACAGPGMLCPDVECRFAAEWVAPEDRILPGRPAPKPASR